MHLLKIRKFLNPQNAHNMQKYVEYPKYSTYFNIRQAKHFMNCVYYNMNLHKRRQFIYYYTI